MGSTVGEEVAVRLDPDYPHLAIWEDPESRIRIPVGLMENIRAAWAAEESAKLEIMRYVGEHYDVPMVREWLAEHDDDAGEIDGE